MTARTCLRLAPLALLLSLAAPVAAQAPAIEPAPKAPPAPAVPAAVLPPAADVVAKATAAVGGRDAWAARTSVAMKSSMEIPALNMKGSMTTFAVAPNRMAMTLDRPGLGKVRSGFDGTHAWSTEPSGGPRLMTGEERDMIARESDWLGDIDLAKQWDSLVTTGEGEFAGVPCWKVEATKSAPKSDPKPDPKSDPKPDSKPDSKADPKSGDLKAILWFEKETGLPRGSETTADTQLGKIPVVTAILEYGTFDGLKVATRSETKQMGQRMVTLIESVVFDAVTPAEVELPAEVKALLEPEPAEEGEEGEDAEATGQSAPAAPAAPKQP